MRVAAAAIEAVAEALGVATRSADVASGYTLKNVLEARDRGLKSCLS